MAIQARVTSTDALELFRAKLIVFLHKARTSVDETTEEVRRMRNWLQHDQPMRWEGEIRRRAKALEQAQQEMRTAQFAGNQTSTVQLRQAAVNRTKQALAEAEDKLRRVKKWNQNYDNTADPIVKRLENFRGFITDELPKAIAHLRNVAKILELYADTDVPSSGSAAAPAASPEEQPKPDETAPATEPPVT